jgi:signal transduction histidine kinase
MSFENITHIKHARSLPKLYKNEMQLSHTPEVPIVARQQLLETLMNVPFPLTVLHGPSHQIVLSNRAQLIQTIDRVPVGKTFADAFPELASHVVPILDRVYRDGIPEHEKEVKIFDRFLNCSYIPLRGDGGLIEGVIASTLDVTAEVLIRTTTENQKRWIEYVLDLIPLPTVLVQPGTGEVLLINAAGKRQMNSYPRDVVSQGQIEGYFTDLSGRRLALNDWPRFRAARGEELYGLQLVWNEPGRSVPLVVESRRIPNAFGHPSVIAIHYQDVSDLKEAESTLREAVGELQRERELRESFVTTLTHDLRNPLTAAKLTAELMSREFPDSKPIGVFSRRICGSISRADRMVRDILDANRLKAGESLPLRLGNYCMNDIAQCSIDGLKILYGDRFHLDPSIKIRGRWCRSSLKRVLDNLCGNAAKYASANSPITVHLTKAEDLVEVAVHNYGTPIPRIEQPGLFQPFHRTRTAEVGVQRGWGLGLALVRGLAEAHGGTVRLEFSDERGTQFAVRLPLITSDDR